MSDIHVGASLERPPGAKYRAALPFAELRFVGPLPRPTKLAAWRSGVDSAPTISLVLPQTAWSSSKGAMRFDEELERGFAWAVEAAEALSARFVVLPTGGALRTGQRDRDLLSAWVERWPNREQLVWHPGGLWDPPLALKQAEKLSIKWAVDPLEAEVPDAASWLYARVRAVGRRRRLSETDLLELVDLCEMVGEAWVALDAPKSFALAQRLAALAA